MKNVNKYYSTILSIIFLLCCTNLYAVEFRGVGVETYEGSYSKKKVNEKIKIAKDKGCQNAFKKYVQGMEESKRTIFISIQDQIYSNINEYMTCDSVVSQPDLSDKEEVKKIKKTKEIKVVMRADIDETRLNIEINKSSKVFDSKSADKSKLAMIFFSRTVSSQREFDAKVTKVEKKTKGVDIDEEETDTGISSSTTETNVTQSGGSKLKKRDVTEYVVDDNDTAKLEANMKEIFTKARFEPVSGPRQVRRKWRSLKGDIVDSLESGGGIPEEVQWEIEDILIEKNVSYVVFAYFDIGVPEFAADTGNTIVNVVLTKADVVRLGGGDPVSIGTIGGIGAREDGNNYDVARNNAIKVAAKKTARELVALINSKGIN